MSYGYEGVAGYRAPAGALPVQARARFITRTYNHLFGAIAAFAAMEVLLFQSGIAPVLARAMSGSWLLVLGGFVVASWLFTHLAHNAQTRAAQYFGLGAFVVVESIIFVPMLYIANAVAPGAIQSAAIVTMLGFAGLTGVAFVTKKDFSFLRSFILWAGVLAMVAIVASLIFGFALGTFFSVAMVGLAGASILYDTSNVLRHYPEDRYVGAALQLFASVAMMFWYVLRLFMSQRE
jgi:uncharacterized protein